MTSTAYKFTMFACVAAMVLLLAGFLPAAAQQQTQAQDKAPVAVPEKAQAPAQTDVEKPKPPRYSSDWVEGRIARLHRKLRITPDQESVWSEVAVQMRNNAKAMEALIERLAKQAADMTAVEHLKLHGEIADEHAKGQRLLIPLFEKLYNLMGDDQKKRADDVFAERESRKQSKGK